jgi:hypothetical protein
MRKTLRTMRTTIKVLAKKHRQTKRHIDKDVTERQRDGRFIKFQNFLK